MNSVTLVGNLAAEPRPRSLSNGTACRLRLAVDRRSGAGAVFVEVETFGRLAETCSSHLSTGRLVAVHGRLEQESWIAPDGGKCSRHFVIAAAVEFLDRPAR